SYFIEGERLWRFLPNILFDRIAQINVVGRKMNVCMASLGDSVDISIHQLQIGSLGIMGILFDNPSLFGDNRDRCVWIALVINKNFIQASGVGVDSTGVNHYIEPAFLKGTFAHRDGCFAAADLTDKQSKLAVAPRAEMK